MVRKGSAVRVRCWALLSTQRPPPRPTQRREFVASARPTLWFAEHEHVCTAPDVGRCDTEQAARSDPGRVPDCRARRVRAVDRAARLRVRPRRHRPGGARRNHPAAAVDGHRAGGRRSLRTRRRRAAGRRRQRGGSRGPHRLRRGDTRGRAVGRGLSARDHLHDRDQHRQGPAQRARQRSSFATPTN